MSFSLLSQHLLTIDDPRQAAKISYPLFDILFLTVTAVIAGCEGWEEIEDFGHARLDWLRNYGRFDNGIPVHDTIARVMSRIDPQVLQERFILWMQETQGRSQRRVIAVDGKTLRGACRPGDRQSAIHMVSAFATANGVVMGQCKTDEKSNEITAIPELLRLLELQDSLVTLDAMGCQETIAQTILDKGGDYLLAVKGNQPTLHKAIKAAFGLAPTGGLRHIDKHHGRQECREYHVLEASQVAGLPCWPGVATVGVALRYRINQGGEESLEYRYYVSSARLDREQFANSVRSHWAIENRLHWVLDVALRDDACQIHRGHAPENLAALRHVALNQLRRETSRKASIRRKQRLAALDIEYLERVIHA